MQIKLVNNHAMRKYDHFILAIASVANALDDLDKHAKKVGKPSADETFQAPSQDEIHAAKEKARNQLEKLKVEAKKYEKELISRGWRV